jgi:TrmH family RNA methyltransferase
MEVSLICCLESWMQENRHKLTHSNAETAIVSAEELSKISDLTTPNKVLAIAGIPESQPLKNIDFQAMLLALDDIRDPGNMGTILRTADWFGITQIVCSAGCVDIYNPKVIQATMGSFSRVQLYYSDLTQLFQAAPPDTPIYGALLEAPSILNKNFIKPGILIIGNESLGISDSIRPYITDPVFIPRFISAENTGYQAESLNASVANAIICYEIRKQLLEKKF